MGPVDLLRLAMLSGSITIGMSPVRGEDHPVKKLEPPRRGPSQEPGPFPLNLAFTRRTISDYEKAAVSPTSEHFAYAAFTPMKQRADWWTTPSGLPMSLLGSRVRVVEMATGKVSEPGAEGSSSFSPAWSPDGKTLAYYSDEGGVLRLWLFDPVANRARRAADVRIKAHMYSAVLMPPSWSPDGAHILVPALPPHEAGADPRVVGVVPRPAAEGAAGRRVHVQTTGKEPAAPAERREGVASPYRTEVDVTAVDARTGAAHVVLPAKTPGRTGPAFARYSPSGRFLVYVSAMRPRLTAEPSDVLDLGVVRVGETEPLHAEEIASLYEGRESYAGDQLGRSGVILAWHPARDILLFLNDNRLRRLDCTGPGAPRVETLAPDLGKLNGEYLAFAGDGAEALIGLLPSDAGPDSPRASGLGLVPLAGGAGRRFEMPPGESRGQVVRHDRTSLWEPVANSATLVFTGKDGTSTLMSRLDFSRGTWAEVRAEPATVELHGMPRDRSFLIATIQSYARPPDFYRLGTDFKPAGRLSLVDPRLEGRGLGPLESFETVVPLHDGRLKSVRTAVLLPPGARRGDRLPAILTCYGGSNTSGEAREYGGGYVSTIPTPVFTSRGYAVLLADAPLGPMGRPGNPVEELRDVVLPQAYRAAELGYIDIRRVAVTGQSYGGYCTGALVSSTNLFRAAVDVSGTYDLPGDYGVLSTDDNHFRAEWAEKGQGRMGQPPWSDLRRYLDNSPYYRADRVHTPLLLIHGRADDTCPVRGAEMMFSALRRLDRTAQLAVYEGEGHVILEWDLANAIDAVNRILDFLDRHLTKE